MANGHLSDAYADDLLAAWLTHDVTKLLPSFFVGLTLVLPSDSNGTGLIAPSAPEYARVEIPADAASWALMGVGSRSMESSIDVLYETATVDWGEVKGYTLHDALGGGRYLGFGITNPYIILTGMMARLPAGAIVITAPF